MSYIQITGGDGTQEKVFARDVLRDLPGAKDYIMRNVEVVSTVFRPYHRAQQGAWEPNHLSTIYANILRHNLPFEIDLPRHAYEVCSPRCAPGLTSPEAKIDPLQRAVSLLFNGNYAKQGDATRGRALFTGRLPKKTGVFRNHLMGKRVDYRSAALQQTAR